MCGVSFLGRYYTQKYCGHKLKKIGCAYKNYLNYLKNKPKPVYKDILYYKWEGFIQRCTNKNNPRYSSYGGRGIKVCNRWMTYLNFKKDMQVSFDEHVKIFGQKNTSLDRIDNNKGYCKKNCRWATWSEQQNNKRINSHLRSKSNIKCKTCTKIFFPPKRNSQYCSKMCWNNRIMV